MKTPFNSEMATTPLTSHESRSPGRTMNVARDAQIDPQTASNSKVHPILKRRTERFKKECEALKLRETTINHWLETGSNLLNDACVSVCPSAESHEVITYLLTEIVDLIRTGGSIKINTRWGPKDINLAENQQQVRRLFESGFKQARKINSLRVKSLLDQLELNVKVDNVEVIPIQPDRNQKTSYIDKIIVEGNEHDVYGIGKKVVYLQPQMQGKVNADAAKKMTPGVTLAGVFLPQRNKIHLLRTTGLYPLDLDGVDNLEETRTRINNDAHVYLCFTSITGSGLRACVYGPAAKNADEYERFYKTIAQMKSKAWGLEAKIDNATFDCSRLTFLPYDTEISFNP